MSTFASWPGAFSSWPGLTRPSTQRRSGSASAVVARPTGEDGRVKPGHDGWRRFLPALLTVLLLSLATHAFAVEPSERLADPKLEARAESIGRTLRCLVCQNESIEESNASLAHDIRVLLRQLLLKGDTNAQARQAIVARYGQFVLLKPPVEPATYVLWYGPPTLVAIGLAGSLLWLRRRRPSPIDTNPLTPEETARLDGLMQEHDG